MTQTKTPIDYTEYDSPDDIANDSTLTHTQKMDMLKAWAVDAQALARASAEGLNGGEQDHLKAVQDTINTLKASQ